MNVEFTYSVGIHVVTDTGVSGIIRNAMVDSSGIQSYYVAMTNGQSDWFKEDQLNEV